MITSRREDILRRRRRNTTRTILLIVSLIIIIGAAGGFGAYYFLYMKDDTIKPIETTAQTETAAPTTPASDDSRPADTTSVDATSTEAATDPVIVSDDLLKQAERYAAMYDYDKAISLITSLPDYAGNEAYVQAVNSYISAKNTLVKWPDNTQITHIFFHTLMPYPEITFKDPTATKSKQYNEVMTSVSEFKAIIQEMYDRGYVLVTPYDMARLVTDESGNTVMARQPIYLPAGKKPFVLSQDDVCYYEYMTGDGFASRLVIDETGKITNEIVDPYTGEIKYGSYDVLPILDDFINEHPDFSYRGAKGILAVTGYNGILGYRTSHQNYGAESTANSSFLYVNPNIDADIEEARKVAQAIKEDGWLFASHSWGHRYYGTISIDDLKWDALLWEEEVESIIGETDLLIFAFGNDIGSWRQYEETNERFTFLRDLGFHYFFNVDASVEYWVQISAASQYLRQGRRNLDGTRMWEAVSGKKDRLSDLFDASAVFDPARPTPVE